MSNNSRKCHVAHLQIEGNPTVDVVETRSLNSETSSVAIVCDVIGKFMVINGGFISPIYQVI
jgi:hypothetical protein